MDKRLLELAKVVTLPLACIALYWVASSTTGSVFLPTPPEIGSAMVEWVQSSWQKDIVPSIRNLVVGYVIGSLAGIALGILLGRNPAIRWIVEPVATFVRSIPPIALVPIFMLSLGIGDFMRVTVIAVGVFFPVLVSAIDGAAGIESALDDVVAVNHISKRDQLFDIIIPGAMPQILTGMKTSLTIAIILIFTSELLGATSGIGAFILESQRFFAMPSLWAGTLLLGLLGLVLSWLFEVAETRLLAWRT